MSNFKKFSAYTDVPCDWVSATCPSDGEVERLQAENAKLREALRAAWKCAHAGISCFDCRLIAGGCTLQSAMCELGIEVPK